MRAVSIRCAMLAMLVFAGQGCSRAGDSSAPKAAGEQPSPEASSRPQYEGPPAELEVVIDGPASDFRWTVTAPTGGWEMRFEGARTNPRTDHGAVEVVLVRPGPDEMVTQAQQVLDGSYRHGRMNARTAELLIRVVTRGEEDDDTEDYRRAASWSDGS